MNASSARLGLAPPTILTSAPVPGAQPTPPDPQRTGPQARPFAELLQQNRLRAAVGAPAPPAPPPTHPVEPTPDGASRETRAAAARSSPARSEAATGKTDLARPHADEARANAGQDTEAASASDAEAAERIDDDDKPASDAAGRPTPAEAAARSAALAAPLRAAADRTAVDRAATDETRPTEGRSDGKTSIVPHVAGEAAAERRSGRTDSAATQRAGVIGGSHEPAGTLASPADFTATLAAMPESAPPRAASDSASAALASLSAAGAPSASSTTGTDAAPGLATLATPLASADFPAAFGLQVRLLAEGGVQQAELHLNPAEMGPVSIRIAIDGTQARIDFGADLLATRQAIENGLPELAGALRDAGFTLAGGGVSQHASSGRQRDGDPAGGSRRGDGGTGFTATAGEPARVLRRLGSSAIDLYA